MDNNKKAKRKAAERKFNEKFKKQMISDSNLVRLENYLKQAHRDDSDWDEIIGILKSGNLLTIVPQRPNKNIKAVDDVLYYSKYLQLFTAEQKLIDGVKKIAEKEPDVKDCTIRCLSFEEVMDIADQHHLNAVVDYREEGLFVTYKSSSGRVEASVEADSYIRDLVLNWLESMNKPKRSGK